MCLCLRNKVVSTITLCIISFYFVRFLGLPCFRCFDSIGWAAGRASGLKKQWWGAGVVVCLVKVQTVSCFSKIQIGFAFLVPAHSEKGLLNVCVCFWTGVKRLLADCATEAAEVGVQRIREQTSAAGNVRHVPRRRSHRTSSAVTSRKTLLQAETVQLLFCYFIQFELICHFLSR